MKISYKVLRWDPASGNVEVHCSAAPNPQGWTIGVHAIKDDGSLYSREELLARIEAALPVAEFEKLAAHQEKKPDDAHIRVLLTEPARECERTSADQGTLKVAVL